MSLNLDAEFLFEQLANGVLVSRKSDGIAIVEYDFCGDIKITPTGVAARYPEILWRELARQFVIMMYDRMAIPREDGQDSNFT